MCRKHYTRIKKLGTLPPRQGRPTICAVAGCDKDPGKGGHGHCGMHWQRIKRTGSVGATGYIHDPARTDAERIYPRLVERDECWVWTGAVQNGGYGYVGIERHVELVHRWIYQDLIGEIPKGLVLDHLCVNPSCANPWHLDPVTRAVNNARGGYSHGTRKALVS
jgi:hypothetical protein